MAAVLVMTLAARGTDVQTRQVEYRAGETVLQGLMAWDDAVTGKRPGVLVIHEWWGQTDYPRNVARRLAAAGYVGFALDMFGKGKVAEHPRDAQAFVAEATKDPAVIQARFRAGLEQLKQDPHVDPERIATIGYCFGGTIALLMARSGADLDAVVSFHGGLGQTAPAEPGPVSARVLVLTGGADPFAPQEQVAAFEEAMKAAGASYRVETYPGVKHGFTNPRADSRGLDALKYDADAAAKSWAAMLELFHEVW